MAIPLIGIAFGFFIGCSTLPSVNQSQSDSTLSESDLKKRLKAIESQIANNSSNAEAYYQKGDVLHKLAQRQNPPGNRTGFYEEMHNSLIQASSLYQSTDNMQGAERVDELLKVSWSFEHNQGVEILQTDSTIVSEDFDRAASHFNNAIVIIPDSAISYKMKARTLYRNHNVDRAIETLETATSRIEELPAGFLEQLAYLYLEIDQPQKAIELYEKAEEFSDENLNLLHGLANAYITANRHEQAIELLGTLVENKPENIIYLESYGMELYKLGIQKYDSLTTFSAEGSIAINQTKTHADTLLARAQNQYKKILQQNPEAVDVKRNLANLYKNYAVRLTRIKTLFSDTASQRIEENIEANLSNAITLYEELVEQQPNETDYWENLYQAYSYLGMQEEASEAKAKANL